jgi:prevent-host-death family protein
MTRTVAAIEARQRFGQLMNEVQLRHDHVIVERDGKPMVAVVPVEEYEAWMRHRGDFFAQVEAVRARNQSVAPADLAADVRQAVAAVRRNRV